MTWHTARANKHGKSRAKFSTAAPHCGQRTTFHYGPEQRLNRSRRSSSSSPSSIEGLQLTTAWAAAVLQRFGSPLNGSNRHLHLPALAVRIDRPAVQRQLVLWFICHTNTPQSFPRPHHMPSARRSSTTSSLLEKKVLATKAVSASISFRLLTSAHSAADDISARLSGTVLRSN